MMRQGTRSWGNSKGLKHRFAQPMALDAMMRRSRSRSGDAMGGQLGEDGWIVQSAHF